MSGYDPILNKKTIVVALSAGIAAYKAADFVSRLRQAGANVLVCMTKRATEFITPLTLEALSGAPVHVELLGPGAGSPVRHVDLAERADAVVHIPATADLIARLAQGRADDLPTAVTLSTTAPILIVPAMETEMWFHPATQANLSSLREYGYRIMPPAEGRLASGAVGVGRMQEPADIVRWCRGLFAPQDYIGKSILVTAGPTRESFDPVRYWSNYSSGRMGYALAEAARDRGAKVVLVSGPTALPRPIGLEFIPVESAAEMAEASFALGERQDVIIKAAAVADYRPAHVHQAKQPKSADTITIPFVRTTDILLELGKRKPFGQILVGFAAESYGGEERARRKLKEKNCDFIVWNDVMAQGSGFGSTTNQVTIFSSTGEERRLPLLDKYEVAMAILDFIGGEKRELAGGSRR